MGINKLAIIAQELNAALGSGKFHDISSSEVWHHIEQGTIFRFLSDRLGIGVPLSVLGPADRLELVLEWTDSRGFLEPFRFDGHRSGLCVLVAYLVYGMVKRAKKPAYGLLPEGVCGAIKHREDDI